MQSPKITGAKCFVALLLALIGVGLAVPSQAVEYGRYDFTFYYENGAGDRYDGYFFADDSLGLRIGTKKTIAADENGKPGYYIITDFINLHGNGADDKKVFVTNYYDIEGNKYYLPLNYDQPMGTNYWGSETGFIVSKSSNVYRFGNYSGKFWEADGESGTNFNGFTFKYTYGSGDNFVGRVYAPADYYEVGLKWYKADENGDYGMFEITGRTTGDYDPARNGQVWVSSYYNIEDGKSYVPGKYANTQPSGTNYLESVSDWIIAEDNQYRFGEYYGWKEADVVARYNFTYYYNNGVGDRFTGFVYAGTDYNDNEYYVGYITNKNIDENGQEGYYKITSIVHGSFDLSLRGKVFVTKYYDKESNLNLNPVQYYDPDAVAAGTNYCGTNYLGSEMDFILKSGYDQYRFGKYYSWREADTTNQYSFTYTFSNGDYYQGYVLAGSDYNNDYYKVGTTWQWQDESQNWRWGTGKITAVAFNKNIADNGKVFVTKYHDAESNLDFQPVKNKAGTPSGTNYIGSEMDFILKDGVDQYRFGEYYGKREADVTAKYSFSYTYGLGDRYDGYFFAGVDRGYYLGWTQLAKDDDKKFGKYQITGVSYLDPNNLNYSYVNNGKVYVTNYYDKETDSSTVPLNATNPLGTNYLGSEWGYIRKAGVDQYRFGMYYGLVREADYTMKYNFKFTYGDGDYYSGWLYAVADPNYYVLNRAIIVKKDENGRWGSYTITSAGIRELDHTRNGQVWVDKYYYKYGKTPGTYIPFKYKANTYAGTGYLGSEIDYIIVNNDNKYRFGQGYYEVDRGL